MEDKKNPLDAIIKKQDEQRKKDYINWGIDVEEEIVDEWL
jgi:hypothetical protein